MSKANKIAFNTGITYAKAAITIIISLYATRLVLNALGAADFGLFNVIGGVVAMLSFLNAAMTTATQRYISFSLGEGDINKVKKVFVNSLILHYALGVLLVAVVEVIGMYFINYKLEISPERLTVANWVFHFVVVSTFFSIVSVPYDAVVNAHENMLFLAIVSIFETLLRLVIAAYLYYTNEDRLMVFGFLTMLSAIIIRIIKRIYSRRKYEETHVSFKGGYQKDQIKQLTSFAGWNLLGVLCYIGRNQGIAVVLNLFFATVINAAYGIANQVNAQLTFFSSTMIQAIQPQIVKSEGSGDRARLITLSVFSSKVSFFLFALVAIPIYAELPFVLKLWLKDVPESTTAFCRCIIILTFILQLRSGITMAVHAIGNIKKYQLINSPIQLLAIPVGYLLFRFGNYPPYSIVVVSILVEAFVLLLSINFFSKLTGYSVFSFYRHVIIPCAFIFGVCYVFSVSLAGLNSSLLYKASMAVSTVLLYCLLVFFFGFDKMERTKLLAMVQNIRNKVFKTRLT